MRAYACGRGWGRRRPSLSARSEGVCPKRKGRDPVKKEIFTAGGRDCTAYACSRPQYLLIQPVDDSDLSVLDAEAETIARGAGEKFILAAFAIKAWDQELSPWTAPPVFGKIPFGNGAETTLRLIEESLLPDITERFSLSQNIPVILGGYSLAGFFALWSGYQTDRFSAVMAASPSVWFPGWMEYARTHPVRCDYAYLSLGRKEGKTKNKTMAAVEENIRIQHELLCAEHAAGPSKPKACILEWNEGNHFADPDKRCAKGFIWCMRQSVTERQE